MLYPTVWVSAVFPGAVTVKVMPKGPGVVGNVNSALYTSSSDLKSTPVPSFRNVTSDGLS